MAPAILLIAAAVAFRVLGSFGVAVFESWRDCVRFALALMFLFTATAHFGPMKEDLLRMVPPSFPNARLLVFWTGLLEILGTVGLLFPSTRRLAAWGLAILLVAMFPANVSAARRRMTLRGKPITPLALRVPLQLLFLSATLWIALA